MKLFLFSFQIKLHQNHGGRLPTFVIFDNSNNHADSSSEDHEMCKKGKKTAGSFYVAIK